MYCTSVQYHLISLSSHSAARVAYSSAEQLRSLFKLARAVRLGMSLQRRVGVAESTHSCCGRGGGVAVPHHLMMMLGERRELSPTLLAIKESRIAINRAQLCTVLMRLQSGVVVTTTTFVLRMSIANGNRGTRPVSSTKAEA